SSRLVSLLNGFQVVRMAGTPRTFDIFGLYQRKKSGAEGVGVKKRGIY
ncbi:uncharacterized protein METZ01_LOCUS327202, partial [marine metagenome]